MSTRASPHTSPTGAGLSNEHAIARLLLITRDSAVPVMELNLPKSAVGTSSSIAQRRTVLPSTARLAKLIVAFHGSLSPAS
jgi:hypothetical protein